MELCAHCSAPGPSGHFSAPGSALNDLLLPPFLCSSQVLSSAFIVCCCRLQHAILYTDGDLVELAILSFHCCCAVGVECCSWWSLLRVISTRKWLAQLTPSHSLKHNSIFPVCGKHCGVHFCPSMRPNQRTCLVFCDSILNSGRSSRDWCL